MKRRDEPTSGGRPFWQELLLAVATPVATAFCEGVKEYVQHWREREKATKTERKERPS